MRMPDGQNGAGILKTLIEQGLGYLWFVVLALWGGTASYINRVRKTKSPFSFIELVGEWTISGFAGLMTAFVCAEMGLSFYLTAALAGVSGHMGGRAIFIMERWAQTKMYWKPENGAAPFTTGKDDENYPSRGDHEKRK